MLINYAARAGPPLHYVDWTMKYCLGEGENSFLETVLEFVSWLQSVLLSASFYSIILKENKLRYLFREFVLEKRFACCSANRIWKILCNSHVQNPLFVNLHTLHVQFMTRK